MTPYYLKSGPKAGQAMEAIMFDLDGYYRLEAVLRKNDGSKDWLRRLRDLMRRAENPTIVVKCECGAIATHVGVAIRDCGVTIKNTCCANCRDQFQGFATAVPIKFSSLREYFRHEIDRKQFLRALRSACGLIESGPIPPQSACDAFYPPTPELRSGIRRASPPTLPSTSPPKKIIPPPIHQPEQLPLF